MKNIVILLAISFLGVSCKNGKSESEQEYFYKAVNSDKLALLSLTIGEKYFFGHYEVRYGKSGKDFGEVRGNIFGDTLRGKFKYLSFGGNNKITPFVLLKHDEIFKFGSGIVSSYLNIPYYIPETLEFKDTDFQFYRIDRKSAENLGLVTQ